MANVMDGAKQKLARVVYRSLLRASGNGRYPEVFGKYATSTAALNSSCRSDEETTFPSTAEQVRRALHHAFAQPNMARPNEGRDMFDALRCANELSSILRPREESLCEVALPVFDYRASAAMIGETLHFNFFEPRYRKLVQKATSAGADGLFILRARPVLDDMDASSPPLSMSVLMKIVQHTDVNADTISVRCIAGPRLRVLQQEQVSVRMQQEEQGMILATNIAVDKDIVCDQTMKTATILDTNANHDLQNASLVMMRSRCLDLLCAVTPRNSLLSFGLPPLDPEYFSFWSLRLVFDSSDTPSRHKWLSCHSTLERLTFITALLEKFQTALREKEVQNHGGIEEEKEKGL